MRIWELQLHVEVKKRRGVFAEWEGGGTLEYSGYTGVQGNAPMHYTAIVERDWVWTGVVYVGY